MTSHPLDHPSHSDFPWMKVESVGDFTSPHAQLSVGGKQVLDHLLLLLPSHLEAQKLSRFSSFPPALLFSICEVLQSSDNSNVQIDPSILPSVLGKLRDWRLLNPDHRYSPGGVFRLALELAGIINKTSTSPSSGPKRPSHAHLRIKWLGSDLQSGSKDRELSLPTSSSPSPSQSDVLHSAQECAHTLDLKNRSCQTGRLGTPDSEDTSVALSPRYRSVSGFRSGCSACRHLRLTPPTSTQSSPRMMSVSLTDVKQFDMNINSRAPSPRLAKSIVQSTPFRNTRPGKHKPSRSLSLNFAYVDENKSRSKPTAIQQCVGVSFPRQLTRSPLTSNPPLPREPFSPVATSTQRCLAPSHVLNQAGQGDKHTTSHRFASVGLRLSIHDPRPTPASLNDLHPPPPMHAHAFSYTPTKSHGVGSVGGRAQKLSSSAAGLGSSKRLPSWSRTHPTAAATSVTPGGSMSPLAAKTPLANPQPHPCGARSRASSALTPRSLQSDVKHRDRRLASSKTHRHASSVGILPLSSASPLIHARKWQV